MPAYKLNKLPAFAGWIRMKMVWLTLIPFVVTSLYVFFDFTWLSIPSIVVILYGIESTLITGFVIVMKLKRNHEAEQIWKAAMIASREWVLLCRNLINNKEKSKELIDRHFAWLTVLRYQLLSRNNSYSENLLKKELSKYISNDELKFVLRKKSRTGQIQSIQSKAVTDLSNLGFADSAKSGRLYKYVVDFYNYEGKIERIKCLIYNGLYFKINSLFVNIFCLILPFGMLKVFEGMNANVKGFMQGKMIWLIIPFSILSSLIFTSLDKFGQKSENPLKGIDDMPIQKWLEKLPLIAEKMQTLKSIQK